jgi:hypothetical protein
MQLLEKCEKLADLLIPGDPSLGLINLSEVLRDRFIGDAEFQNLAKAFIIEIEEFLGHEFGTKEVRIAQLDQFLKNTRGCTKLFLSEILELYYTDERVLKFYPNFSGNIFPNYRRLPTIKFEILEHVISDPDDLES